jgi:DNA (cytosine-5)-methyltransferase 1
VANSRRQRRDGKPACLRQPEATGRDQAHRSEAARGREARNMADASGERRQRREAGQTRAGLARTAHGIELGDAISEGLSVGPVTDEQQRTVRVKRATFGEAGTLRGAWSGAEWIECSDGRRRPAEPGTFPLAHGAPARVGRLRAYGNAIVPQVAATFIGAYLEASAPTPSPDPASGEAAV